MNILDFVKQCLSVNSFLNEYAYKIRNYCNLNYMYALVNDFSKDDSIYSVENLRRFRNSIENKKTRYFGGGSNFFNSHIYGIWNCLYGNLNIDVIKTPAIEHGLILRNQIYYDLLESSRACYGSLPNFV